MSYPTLLDIVKANDVDRVAGLIDETLRLHPEMMFGAARTIPGLEYRTLVRTALGNTTGSFRAANAGSSPVKSTYENRLVQCYISEPRIQCDVAVANSYIDGPEAYMALEAGGALEGEWQAHCRQFYYGATAVDGSAAVIGNAKGFPGLIDAYDSTNMVVDAGGTTANTGSSAWFVRFGPQQVQWVYGGNAGISFSPTRIQSIADTNDATKLFEAYIKTALVRPGLQVGSLWSAVRIKKLTADAGKGLTDTLVSQALAKFPAGSQPDACFLSRRSLEQLRTSRTTYNPQGAPAPFPTAVSGIAGQNIPIYVTDSIINTEPLTL